MGAGSYSHTTRATGITLTATIYNSDHVNHITNHNFPKLDDYSSNNSQMQTTTDPYSGGSESLATSGAGELERLRYMLRQIAFPRSYLAGYGLSVGTDTDHDIDIAIGQCKEVGETITGRTQWYMDPEVIILASAITKQIDAAWAVGTDAGGLDTGSVANATWYHLFVIKRSDTEVVDVLFSTSATSPTMPTNYDTKRRLGSVLTDGSANIIAFAQIGNEFLWSVPVRDWNTGTPGSSAVLRTCSVPTGIQVDALLHCIAVYVGTSYWLHTSPDQADTAPTSSLHDLRTAAASTIASSRMRIRTNTSAQIRNRSSSAAAVVTTAVTFGWYDRRGRDD